MSTLSQFAPFAAGGIKSIQTGFAAVNAAGTTTGTGEDLRYTNVTISSVDTAKSVPSVFGSGNRSTTLAPVFFAGPDYIYSIILPRLTSSTNLRLSSAVSSVGPGESTSISGRWYVVESN